MIERECIPFLMYPLLLNHCIAMKMMSDMVGRGQPSIGSKEILGDSMQEAVRKGVHWLYNTDYQGESKKNLDTSKRSCESRRSKVSQLCIFDEEKDAFKSYQHLLGREDWAGRN